MPGWFLGDSGSGSRWLAAPDVLEFAPSTMEFAGKWLFLRNYHLLLCLVTARHTLTSQGRRKNLVCGSSKVALNKRGFELPR